MKRYKANRKGFLRYVALLTILLGTGVLAYDASTFTTEPLLLLPLLSPVGLLLWIYFGTYYEVDQTSLTYTSGFIKGQIDVRQIREISMGVTHWVGLKPALARHGLLISYNRFDEVYIAPEDNQELVNDLLTINGAIVVKRSQGNPLG